MLNFIIMKLVLARILTVITSGTLAQKEIELKDVREHIGDSVVLKADVYGAK